MEAKNFLISTKVHGAYIMQGYASTIVQGFDLLDGENGIASDTNGNLWYLTKANGTQRAYNLTALINGKVDASEKGVANGVATLGGDGKVPASQLPSYVDDVIDSYIVSGATAFSAGWLSATSGGAAFTPETGKIYVIVSSGQYANKTYRWSGTTYAEIGQSLVIGTVAGTAYDGGQGAADKSTMDAHIANKSNPHSVTKAQVGLGSTVDGAKPGVTLTFAATAWQGSASPYTITIPSSSYSALSNGRIVQFADDYVAGVERTANSIVLTSNVKQAITVYIL